MTWQDKERERYREKLEREFTPDGERRYFGDDLPSGPHPDKFNYNPDMGHSTKSWHQFAQAEDFGKQGWWERTENTREICGND